MVFGTPNATSGITGLMDYGNAVTNGFFGYSIILMVFVILYAALKIHQSEKAFTVTSFVSLMVTILLAIGGWVSSASLALMIVLLLVAIFIVDRT